MITIRTMYLDNYLDQQYNIIVHTNVQGVLTNKFGFIIMIAIWGNTRESPKATVVFKTLISLYQLSCLLSPLKFNQSIYGFCIYILNLLLQILIGFLHGLLLSICCCLLTKSSDMLNKNTLGAKKLRGQSEAAIKWFYMRPKCVISG